MHRVIFHPEADAELVASAKYYESQTQGLGRNFLDDSKRGITGIQQFPNAWPMREADIRCRLLKRFPYGLLYRVESDHIRILAVMHLHREPDYWKHRA